MDVTDALRRIVMRHLVLIAIATLIPVLGFAAYKASKPATYTASVQLEVGGRSATSAQQATATADNPIAIVKSQDIIAQALAKFGIKHNALDFQQNNLTASPVLTAPDITIVVKYTDAQTAVNIAQELAQLTGDHLYSKDADPVKANLASLTARMKPLQDQKVLDLNAITRAGTLGNPGAQADLSSTNQLIGQLQTQIDKVSTDLSSIFQPNIVDTAKIVPMTSLAKLQPYVLVIVLGLILGVGISAVIESAAPSVVGAAGLAGLFGAPHLGYAVGRNGKIKGRITDLALAARLHAAARRVGADTVVIAGDIRCDLPDLAGRLDALLGGATNQQIHAMPGQAMDSSGAPDPKMLNAGDGSKELATRQSNAPAMFSERLSFGEDEQVLLLLSTAPVSVAVAVVGAPKGKRKNLTPAIELVETSGWEILGTIVADATHKPGPGAL